MVNKKERDYEKEVTESEKKKKKDKRDKEAKRYDEHKHHISDIIQPYLNKNVTGVIMSYLAPDEGELICGWCFIVCKEQCDKHCMACNDTITADYLCENCNDKKYEDNKIIVDPIYLGIYFDRLVIMNPYSVIDPNYLHQTQNERGHEHITNLDQCVGKYSYYELGMEIIETYLNHSKMSYYSNRRYYKPSKFIVNSYVTGVINKIDQIDMACECCRNKHKLEKICMKYKNKDDITI